MLKKHTCCQTQPKIVQKTPVSHDQLTNLLGEEVKTWGQSLLVRHMDGSPSTVRLAVQGKWGLQGQSSCCRAFSPCYASWNWGGVGRTLVVRVCVVAPPVALCGTSRGRLVADRVTGDRRPPIRGVCVMPLLSMMGVGGLSLGLCSPPWMAVMGSGSTLTMVWWIMMMVVLSPPKEKKETNNPWLGGGGSGKMLGGWGKRSWQIYGDTHRKHPMTAVSEYNCLLCGHISVYLTTFIMSPVHYHHTVCWFILWFLSHQHKLAHNLGYSIWHVPSSSYTPDLQDISKVSWYPKFKKVMLQDAVCRTVH